MIKYDGKPFTGVTYNQGAFAGDRGHLFIKGEQQCNYGLNKMARNRVWNPLTKIAQVQNLINNGEICKQCAQKVMNLINQN